MFSVLGQCNSSICMCTLSPVCLRGCVLCNNDRRHTQIIPKRMLCLGMCRRKVPTFTMRRNGYWTKRKGESVSPPFKVSVCYGRGKCLRYILSQSDRLRISSACMIGQDRQAWIYRSQLAYSAHELSQKYTVLASTVNEDEIRMARVVNNTSWGLFNNAT